jgi:hypothetical protein
MPVLLADTMGHEDLAADEPRFAPASPTTPALLVDA